MKKKKKAGAKKKPKPRVILPPDFDPGNAGGAVRTLTHFSFKKSKRVKRR